MTRIKFFFIRVIRVIRGQFFSLRGLTPPAQQENLRFALGSTVNYPFPEGTVRSDDRQARPTGTWWIIARLPTWPATFGS